ncbi:MAG: hypothetical protein HRT88_24140 [Lentisphaeraceae bacterium]|nr:hypothetical protein [Lentisphaeraceae bacterium]
MSHKHQKIMIIRHAEKPKNDSQGIDEYGVMDSESLIVKGWQRAGALVTLFDPLQSNKLKAPDLLYAAHPGKKGERSKRPLETITSLHEHLKEKKKTPINQNFEKDDFNEMIEHVLRQQETVLICWEHEDIPHIANLILQSQDKSPQKWHGDRFDLVWVFDLEDSGKYHFSQVPQNLLKGDKNKPMKTEVLEPANQSS